MRACVALVVLGLGCSAYAQPKAKAVETTCDVIEVSASSAKDPSIDPDIKHIEKKLSDFPASWNVFKKLSRVSATLEKGKLSPLNLKMGSGSATLVEIVDKSKVRLTIKLDYNGKTVVNNATVTVEAGDYVVVGHPISGSKKDGHLLAVTCK